MKPPRILKNPRPPPFAANPKPGHTSPAAPKGYITGIYTFVSGKARKKVHFRPFGQGATRFLDERDPRQDPIDQRFRSHPVRGALVNQTNDLPVRVSLLFRQSLQRVRIFADTAQGGLELGSQRTQSVPKLFALLWRQNTGCGRFRHDVETSSNVFCDGHLPTGWDGPLLDKINTVSYLFRFNLKRLDPVPRHGARTASPSKLSPQRKELIQQIGGVLILLEVVAAPIRDDPAVENVHFTDGP